MQDSRWFRIVYTLLDTGKCTASELAEKLEVSVRTIYRDLDALSAAGIPVYATQGKGGGVSLLPEYVLDNVLLSGEEKEKILMALQDLSAADETAGELLVKLGALFQTRAADWIEVDFSERTGSGCVQRHQNSNFQESSGYFFLFWQQRRLYATNGRAAEAGFQRQGLVFIRILPVAEGFPLF